MGKAKGLGILGFGPLNCEKLFLGNLEKGALTSFCLLTRWVARTECVRLGKNSRCFIFVQLCS